MVKAILKYVACVAIPATIFAAIVTVLITQSLYGQIRLPYGGNFVLSKLLYIFTGTVSAYVVMATLILAPALLMRRARWPLIGCFAAAWVLMTAAQTTFSALTVSGPLAGHISWLTVLPSCATLVGILTVAVALMHRWLFGRPRKETPDAVF